MKIQKYLRSVRREKIKIDLASISFIFMIAFTALLLIFILLESIFYFSPFYKKLALLTIILSSIVIMIWLVFSYIIIKQNRNKEYSWDYLAMIIGKVIFPKNQDTALNAFQIESQVSSNQSKDLANNFIDKTAQKLLM
jgi:hypothetical protein